MHHLGTYQEIYQEIHKEIRRSVAQWGRGSVMAIALGSVALGIGVSVAPPAAAQAQLAQAQLAQSQLAQSQLAQSQLAQSQLAPNTTRMLRIITVTGQSSEKIPSTLADIQLGVEAQAKTAQEVQQTVAQRSSAVVALLKSRSVQKLQTTGINLSPQYNYDNGKQTLIGYQASNTVRFRVPIAQAGVIMDDAVKAGASRIDNISFTASDQAIAEAQKLALRKAAQDAQDQAAAVLSVLGLSPKEIVSIQLNGANAPSPVPYPVAKLSMDARVTSAPPTPVEGGEQSVQASVTLQISY